MQKRCWKEEDSKRREPRLEVVLEAPRVFSLLLEQVKLRSDAKKMLLSRDATLPFHVVDVSKNKRKTQVTRSEMLIGGLGCETARSERNTSR